MSVVQQPPPPPAVRARPVPVEGSGRRFLATTPERMRLLAAIAAVVALTFGLAAAQAFRMTSAALQRADDGTAQLLRVQQIDIDLARADATATNSFLVGGLERADQREAYLDALGEASELIARAATAQPADADALAALNAVVVSYSGTIEQARANNRQNLQVGAQYLREASASLRADARPLLDALTASSRARIGLELDAVTQNRQVVYGVGLLAVAVLVGGSVWLALRTRRYLNLGLVAALVLLAVPLVAGGSALSSVGDTVRQTQRGDLTDTIDLASARAQAFDARSNESLTLVARGSGASFQTAWEAASSAIIGAVPADLDTLWQAYAEQHQAMRALDDAGDWNGAVAAATDADGALSTTFVAFDADLVAALDTRSTASSDALTQSLPWLPWAGWLTLVAGVVAAAAAWRGVGARLEEYR